MSRIDDFAENSAAAAKLCLPSTTPAACPHSRLRVRLARRRQWPWLVPAVAYGMLAGRLRRRSIRWAADDMIVRGLAFIVAAVVPVMLLHGSSWVRMVVCAAVLIAFVMICNAVVLLWPTADKMIWLATAPGCPGRLAVWAHFVRNEVPGGVAWSGRGLVGFHAAGMGVDLLSHICQCCRRPDTTVRFTAASLASIRSWTPACAGAAAR